MTPAIAIQHETFELRGGQALFAQSWTPVFSEAPASEVQGVIGIVHGLGEHSSRFGPLAKRLVQSRFRVVAYDQRGHGRTSGKRGDAPSLEVLLDDIDVLVAAMTEDDVALPRFLFGQSFGGMLALNFALRRRPQLNGIIVSSPLLSPTHPPPRWKQLAARILRRVCPSVRFRTGVEAEGLSHDPRVVAAYKDDPFVHDLVSARLAVAMLDAGQWAAEHAGELIIPTLLMHGLSDPITSPQPTIDFAQRAGRLCMLHTFPGLYHELHWERERDAVFDVVRVWLQQSLRP